MIRRHIDLVTFLFLAAALFAAAALRPDPRPQSAPAQLPAIEQAGAETIQGKGIRWWALHAVQARRDANARAETIRRLEHVVRKSTTIHRAIELAAVAYHVDASLLDRRARCESTGGSGYDPNAIGSRPVGNERPLGLFQFLSSTWRSTPFAAFSPFDPLAAALAAAWMEGPAHRGAEWACR